MSLMAAGRPCLVVLQLYLEDLEVKVTPVDKSPPSLSSSWLSWAGTAVNLGPPRLLLLHIINLRLSPSLSHGD